MPVEEVRGGGQDDRQRVCVRAPRSVHENQHMCILSAEDRLTATEPCCGLIPSKVTEGQNRGHVCVDMCVHEREGLSGCVHMQPNTYTRAYSDIGTTWTGLGKVERHRGPTVCPTPTVHSCLSPWTYTAHSTTSG